MPFIPDDSAPASSGFIPDEEDTTPSQAGHFARKVGFALPFGFGKPIAAATKAAFDSHGSFSDRYARAKHYYDEIEAKGDQEFPWTGRLGTGVGVVGSILAPGGILGKAGSKALGWGLAPVSSAVAGSKMAGQMLPRIGAGIADASLMARGITAANELGTGKSWEEINDAASDAGTNPFNLAIGGGAAVLPATLAKAVSNVRNKSNLQRGLELAGPANPEAVQTMMESPRGIRGYGELSRNVGGVTMPTVDARGNPVNRVKGGIDLALVGNAEKRAETITNAKRVFGPRVGDDVQELTNLGANVRNEDLVEAANAAASEVLGPNAAMHPGNNHKINTIQGIIDRFLNKYRPRTQEELYAGSMRTPDVPGPGTPESAMPGRRVMANDAPRTPYRPSPEELAKPYNPEVLPPADYMPDIVGGNRTDIRPKTALPEAAGTTLIGPKMPELEYFKSLGMNAEQAEAAWQDAILRDRARTIGGSGKNGTTRPNPEASVTPVFRDQIPPATMQEIEALKTQYHEWALADARARFPGQRPENIIAHDPVLKFLDVFASKLKTLDEEAARRASTGKNSNLFTRFMRNKEAYELLSKSEPWAQEELMKEMSGGLSVNTPYPTQHGTAFWLAKMIRKHGNRPYIRSLDTLERSLNWLDEALPKNRPIGNADANAVLANMLRQ